MLPSVLEETPKPRITNLRRIPFALMKLVQQEMENSGYFGVLRPCSKRDVDHLSLRFEKKLAEIEIRLLWSLRSKQTN